MAQKMRPWHNISAVDVIAALFIVAAIVSMIMQVDSGLGAILTLIAGYYFGKKSSTLPPGSQPPTAL